MTNHALDRISGFVFAGLGLLVLIGAWQMPRFEAQGAPAYQSPGLAPGLLAVALTVCGLILAFRKPRADGNETGYWNKVAGHADNRKRALAAIVLTLTYAGVLFGLVPYIVATFLFVFAFVYVFEQMLVPIGDAGRAGKLRTVSIASVLAGLTAFGTHYVFEKLFLVQLP